ncbi:MAG: amidohydrolase family protein [bacterium]|nr:amidohydrolase family protein [bacterium]
MTLVDTHCHIGLHKYEPVESLLFHMAEAGVHKAVFIQYMGNPDNQYIVDCMAAHPGRFAATMIVEPDDDGTQIKHWVEHGIGGIRLPAQDRAACADPLAHWRTAAELGLVVSAPCSPRALLSDEFQEVITTFPDLSIVIEHLAGVGKNAQPPYTEFKNVLNLAKHPNLTIKLSGFGEFCELPHPFKQIPPLADMALEAFGPKRMMWGSDYPPASSREGYNNALRFPLEYFSSLSQDERAWIFGKTALKTWKFDTSDT